MARTIYLAVFSNGSKYAHWAVFIPTDNVGTKGKLIHVVGNLAMGFSLEFSRNYDIGATRRDYELIAIGQVEDRNVSDEPRGTSIKDTTARDRLEMNALSVQAPGPSPDPFAAQNDPNRKSCQWWLRQYIQYLINQRLLHHSALQVLDSAPTRL